MTAGAGVDLAVVESRREWLDRVRAPGVRPRVDGGDRTPRAVESEQAVPEGAEPDAGDVAGARQHGVDDLGGRVEQPRGVVLDPAVGSRPRLVFDAVARAGDRRPCRVVHRRASRGGADVEGDEHDRVRRYRTVGFKR
jgi:hypothetical protein